MKTTLVKSESPFAKKEKALKANISGSNDNYGGCSIESFTSASSLSYTHEDAKGWLDYVTQFRPANFWFKDSGVKVWAYEEAYDNWQDTYGADAVNAFYHSGHGNMDGNGVFQAPMGGKWDNRDWAFSNNMILGNETVRYIFWSTCFSCRVLSGHNPIRSRNPVNRGFRMLFGFETVSVDDPDYGKKFWSEWNKGKSFSTAWMDASWNISNYQAPSMVATGINSTEAHNRAFNERLFYSGAGSRNYYQWRWYYARSRGVGMKGVKNSIPSKPMIAIISSKSNIDAKLTKLASDLGFSKKASSNVSIDNMGFQMIKDKDKIFSVSPEGNVDAILGKPNYKNIIALDEEKAISIAEKAIKSYRFNSKADLVFDTIRTGNTCSGTTQGSGKIDKPYITDTMVQFRQVIDGMASVNSSLGLVRVTLDNDGKICNVHNSTKEVTDLSSKGIEKVTPPEPGSKNVKSAPVKIENENDIEKAFDEMLTGIVNKNSDNKAMRTASSAEVINEQVGYDLNDGYGSVVVHRDYEVDMGEGLKKMYKLRVPILS